MALVCNSTKIVSGWMTRRALPVYGVRRSYSGTRGAGFRKRSLVYPGTILAAASVGLLYNNKENIQSSSPPREKTRTTGVRIDSLKTLTYEEVSKHVSEESGVWVTYKEGVYDVTKFVSQHPGGDIIMLAAGQSVDHYWDSYPVHISNETLELLETMRIGNLDTSTVPVQESSSDVEGRWANEPANRNPMLKRNQTRPFNAESPLPILTSQFYTPNDLFYVRNHLPVPERADIKAYRVALCLEGSESKSISLSLDELKKNFPEHTISATIQCAGNRRAQMSAVKQVRGLSWEGGAIGNATWTGVYLNDVINSLGLTSEELKDIKHVQFEGMDEDPATGSIYGASIPISTAMDPNSEVLLAYKMNDEEIPIDHGYPLRVIVPGTVGARNVKWLSRVVLSNEESHSLWQRRDYKLFPPNINIDNVDFNSSSAIQQLPVQSAICSPLSGTTIKLNLDRPLTVKGYAFSGGGRAINRVDVSVDGGKTWHCANIKDSAEPGRFTGKTWSWSLWEVEVPVSLVEKGEVDICCRAFDSSCNTQPEKTESIWNFRGLCNNSWHHVKVNVS